MIRVLKLFLLLLCIGVSFILIWIAKRAGRLDWRDEISCRCYRAMLRIVGVRVTVRGRLDAARPLLAVSNHLSYLDIALLGSAFPFRFVAKQEIASWPGIGACCRVTDAIFIDRKPEKLPQSALAIQRALARGEAVSLFPEATTGNGIRMLPFKSSFFALAETPIDGRELTVQPIAVAYTRIHRLPIDSSQWPGLAWYGDMELVPHLWTFLNTGRIDADLIFLPPATIKQHGDRKRLAQHCEQAIAEAIRAAREKAVG